MGFFKLTITVHKNDFHYNNDTHLWHDADIQHIFIKLKEQKIMGKFLDWNYWSVSDCMYFQLLRAIRWPLCFAVPITSVLWQLAHLNLLCSLSQPGSSWRVEQSRWCKVMLFTHTVPQKRKMSANSGQKQSIKIMLCLKRFEFYSSVGIVQLK